MSKTEWYFVESGNQVLEQTYIQRNLAGSAPCERCDRKLGEHEWIELEESGSVIKCSFSDTKPGFAENFKEYVAFNEKGGIEKRVPRDMMEAWLKLHESSGRLVLGCWEFRRGDEPDEIQVRLSPQCELDGKDNLWRKYLSFVPYFG